MCFAGVDRFNRGFDHAALQLSAANRANKLSLWVDQHFGPGEVEIVDCAPVVIAAPRGARDLVRVLRRTYRGKAETARLTRDAHGRDTTQSALRQLGWLARANPRAALDAGTYAAFALSGRLALAIPRAGDRWERDDSSRIA